MASKESPHLGRRNGIILFLTILLLRICFSFVYRIRIEGVRNIPSDGAFILLPKHQRWTDVPLTAWFSPRPLYYVAKHTLFQNFFTEWYISALGGVPLNRKRPIESRRSLKKVVELLHGGQGVVVFPEGTYYKQCMGPGNIGVVRLILTRVSHPFIPVGISYKRSFPRTKVRISFGSPIYMERDPKTGKPIDPPGVFLESVMKEIARLSDLA